MNNFHGYAAYNRHLLVIDFICNLSQRYWPTDTFQPKTRSYLLAGRLTPPAYFVSIFVCLHPHRIWFICDSFFRRFVRDASDWSASAILFHQCDRRKIKRSMKPREIGRKNQCQTEKSVVFDVSNRTISGQGAVATQSCSIFTPLAGGLSWNTQSTYSLTIT